MADHLAVLDESLKPEEQQRVRKLLRQVGAGDGGLEELAGVVPSTLHEGDDERGVVAEPSGVAWTAPPTTSARCR
jgi:hypothetical protein